VATNIHLDQRCSPCYNIAIVLGAKSWGSVASNDDDDDEQLPCLGNTFLTKREC